MAGLSLLMLPGDGYAQSTAATDGFTPEGLKTGAPAGSFQLSGFDNINYFNGNLNFSLPLLQVGGRGKSGYSIPLRIERKWLVKKTPSIATYVHTPEPSSWQGIDPGYGPGILIGRVTGLPGPNCNNAGNFQTETLTRLTFTAGDGTEYQLRDTTSRNGHSFTTTWSGCHVGLTWNRGKVFVSDDGSGVTFISDEDISDAYDGGPSEQIRPSGHLLLPDGSRYRISDGYVSWIRDRNGNKTSFGYGFEGLTSVTDSLNRQVTIAYLYDETVSQFYDEITYKGFGGAERKIRVWYKILSQVLRSGSAQTFHNLFPELSLTSETNTMFDEWVPASVVLPDGRNYQFKYNAYGELARVELPTGGAIEYDYLEGLIDSTPETGSGVYHNSNGPFIGPQVYRRVSQRRVYADKNSVVFEHQITVSRPEDKVGSGNQGYVDVETWTYPGKG